MKVTENTLNGYLMALAEVNQDANHGCEFYFKKVNRFSDDLEEVLTKHFISEYNPTYSDYEGYEEIKGYEGELLQSLKYWLNSKDIINQNYKREKDERVEKFFELLETFRERKELKFYEVKNKGGFFIVCDFYILQIGEEMYSLELGSND